jgi:hypothetical protein
MTISTGPTLLLIMNNEEPLTSFKRQGISQNYFSKLLASQVDYLLHSSMNN